MGSIDRLVRYVRNRVAGSTPQRTIYRRRATILVSACALTGAVVTASPALSAALSPPTSPGDGGSPTVSNEGSQPVQHTLGGSAQTAPNGKVVPNLNVCSQSTNFTYGYGSGYVGGKISTICTAAEEQQVEVCAEQNYSGSWHSSGTCRTSSLTDTTSLTEYTGALQCTPGRYFRIWSWFYTPAGNPAVTTEFVPGAGGERRC
jgi:hypothetical protein